MSGGDATSGRRAHRAAWRVSAGVAHRRLASKSAVSVLGVFVLIELCWWTPGRSLQRLTSIAVACALPLAAWAWLRHSALAGGQRNSLHRQPHRWCVVQPGPTHGIVRDDPVCRVVGVGRVHLSNGLLVSADSARRDTWTAWFRHAAALRGGGRPLAGETQSCRALLRGLAFITFLPASNLLFATAPSWAKAARLPAVGRPLPGWSLSAWPLTPRASICAGSRPLPCSSSSAPGGARTYTRNRDWRRVSLWRSAVRNAPDSARPTVRLPKRSTPQTRRTPASTMCWRRRRRQWTC